MLVIIFKNTTFHKIINVKSIVVVIPTTAVKKTKYRLKSVTHYTAIMYMSTVLYNFPRKMLAIKSCGFSNVRYISRDSNIYFGSNRTVGILKNLFKNLYCIQCTLYLFCPFVICFKL